MDVKLMEWDPLAAERLIFAKSTRLGLTPALWDEICAMSEEAKLVELHYIANTIKSSHEFTSYTFLISGVSRAFTHQFVRTRTASYAQQSMRVTDQGGYEFVMPPRLDRFQQAEVNHINADIRDKYNDLIADGVAPEDARSILPTNIATNILARYNLRSFCEMARSRAGGRTQDEYRDVVVKMIDCVLKVHPWVGGFLFGDVGRDYFAEIEAFAEREFGGDLKKKGELLKIVDKMRGLDEGVAEAHAGAARRDER